MKSSFAILLPSLGSLLLACSGSEQTGNSIETENALSIQVIYDNGSPAAALTVRVRPLWFMANTDSALPALPNSRVRDLITNSQGKVVLDSLPSGTYLAETTQDSLAGLLEITIEENYDLATRRTLTLSPVGSITGTVDLPAGATYALVFVLGTDRMIRSDSTGFFRLEDLPPGSLRLQGVLPDLETAVGEALVPVRSQRNTDAGTLSPSSVSGEDLQLWQHTKVLDPDSLLPAWARPWAFPSVITLRLHSENFPFAQALRNGQDVRLADSNGKILPMEIAYWNKELNIATLRFRVDNPVTVHLWWGRPAALAQNNPSQLWAGISDSLRLALHSLLIDDFEDTLSQTPEVGQNWYFFPSDSLSTIIPIMEEGLEAGIKEAAPGRTGNAMHFQYSLQNDGSYLLFGLPLGDGNNFSALDSVEFWVRGNGNLTFALDKLMQNAGKAAYQYTLDSNWTRRVIRPQDFLPADNIGGNIGWDLVRDSVTNLTFMVQGGTDFWVDDIRLYGLNRDDLR